jgi:WGR domain
MENLLSLALEAHHSENNHHRRYELKIGRDLFGHWTVSVKYGRTISSGGHELHYSGTDIEHLRAIILDRLLRRLSAPRRIGCRYQLAGFSAAPGVDTSFWLRADIIAQFL